MAKAPKRKPGGASQLLVDLGPVLVFVVVFNVLNRTRPDDAIYIATGVFMAVTLAAIVYSYIRTRHVPPVLIVTGVLITAFGGLTIVLKDEGFVKLKPTVVYLFYAGAILGSLAIRQNVWKLLFRHAFSLPDRIWTVLAVRWAVFFLFMAGLNEVIRHTQTTEVWVNSRLVLVFPLIFIFALANAPLMMKHMREPDAEPEVKAEEEPAS